MTDEMCVALVAVAVGCGVDLDEACDLVDQVQCDDLPVREMMARVHQAAIKVVYPH